VRKLFLIVALIGGAFAGGMAASNGPAVAWARSWVASQAKGIVGEEVTLGPTEPPGSAAPAPVTASAPAPSGMGAAPAATAPTVPADGGEPKPSFPAAPLPLLATGGGAPAPMPASEPAPVPAPAAPSRAPDSPAAAATTPPAAAQPDPKVERTAGATNLASTSISATTSDWPSLRRRLGELGVSRYGTEGVPGGVVRFWCLIPLAGQRAVGQQFEAEGDDEMQAAESALRRITLWRAMEASAAEASPSGLPAGAPGG
jgi:hypothetical protein